MRRVWYVFAELRDAVRERTRDHELATPRGLRLVSDYW